MEKVVGGLRRGERVKDEEKRTVGRGGGSFFYQKE